MRSNNRAAFGLGAWMAVLAIVVLAGLALSVRGWQWGVLKRAVKAQHPEVRLISAGDLADWQEEPKAERPLLIDVRTAEEFAVSHLEGARRVDPEATVAAAGLKNEARDRPIVAYCAVGYRSAGFAQKLQEAGFTEVWNLDGSIFEWVNTGRAVVRDGQKVSVAHPYNEAWGRFLLKEHRAKVAGANAPR